MPNEVAKRTREAIGMAALCGFDSLDQIRELMHGAASEVERLEAENARLKEERDAARSSYEEAAEGWHQLGEINDGLRERLVAAEARISDLEAENTRLVNEVQDYAMQAARLREALQLIASGATGTMAIAEGALLHERRRSVGANFEETTMSEPKVERSLYWEALSQRDSETARANRLEAENTRLRAAFVEVEDPGLMGRLCDLSEAATAGHWDSVAMQDDKGNDRPEVRCLFAGHGSLSVEMEPEDADFVAALVNAFRAGHLVRPWPQVGVNVGAKIDEPWHIVEFGRT